MTRLMIALFGGATLLVVGLVALTMLRATKTIQDLLTENRKLKQAITNLTEERQIGYAKVLAQENRDGKLFTRLLFVETDRQDPTRRILEKEYEIEGDIIFFDALVVKFGNQVVMDGKERSLYLWRRVYGEAMAPASGFPIATPGTEPKRYADIGARLSIRERELFWSEIWQLSNDPDRLRHLGVQAIYGNVVYRKLRPGLIYMFKINNAGNLYPESVPAL